MKALIALLVGSLSTCSTFTNDNGATTIYSAKGLCGGVEVIAVNQPGEASHAYLTVWPEGGERYDDVTPVNAPLQSDVRPFRDPSVVNDWQLTIERGNGEVLFTSRVQRSLPC